MGLLEENGPCLVNADSKTTRLNPWSWNNEVNMVFIDQPVQVGFSYDKATNGTRYVAPGEEDDWLVVPDDFSDGVPDLTGNMTAWIGTFASQNITRTAGSTAQAAHALWHFAQTWFVEFPGYRPIDDRISLWAESYGGHYGPGIFEFFQQRNEEIRNGTAKDKDAQYLHLDTLGIVNGLLDQAVQGEGYIHMAYNNVGSRDLSSKAQKEEAQLTITQTYGIQMINQSTYEDLLDSWRKPDGCKDHVVSCQKALQEVDPRGDLISLRAQNITKLCGQYTYECFVKYGDAWAELGRGWFDIAHPARDPFPPPHMHGFLMEESTLGALGVPVNFSAVSRVVGEAFEGNYDIIRGGFLDAVAYLLDSGVKVHMMYGDRDYACNWLGGQAASLAIPYARAADFAEAGYAPLTTPNGIDGMTRQLGNFSFTRVFQSGHEVPSYQPVAAYEIFQRATFGRDIATGLIPVFDELVTIGPRDTFFIKNVPPEMPEPKCYVAKPETCTEEMWAAVKNGSAIIKDWFVVGLKEDAVLDELDTSQTVIGDL
jgi:carboxypeptidase C (cathepsin A)